MNITNQQKEAIQNAIQIMVGEMQTMELGMGVAYNYEGYTNQQELKEAIEHRLQVCNTLHAMIQETT